MKTREPTPIRTIRTIDLDRSTFAVLADDSDGRKPSCCGATVSGTGLASLCSDLEQHEARSRADFGARVATIELIADGGPLPRYLAAAPDQHGVVHDVKVYPAAGHAFLNDHDPADVPRWAVIAGRLSESDYHEGHLPEPPPRE